MGRRGVKPAVAEWEDFSHDLGLIEPAELIRLAKAAGEFVWDIETTGLDPRKDRLEGIAFYIPPTNDHTEVRAWFPFVSYTFMCHMKTGDIPASYARFHELGIDVDAIRKQMEEWVEGLTDQGIDPATQLDDLLLVDLRPAMDQAETMEALRPIWEVLTSTISICHHAKFDTSFLLVCPGTETPINVKNILGDSMLADFCADERHKRYGLKWRVKQEFGHQMTTYAEAVRGQSLLSFCNAKPLGAYAMDDCYWTYRLHRRALTKLREQTPAPIKRKKLRWAVEKQIGHVMGKLERIYWGIDAKISRILMEMENGGVLIDWRWLREVEERLRKEKEEISDRIEKFLGWPLNPNSGSQVADALFAPPPDGLGLPQAGIPIGKTGNPSTADKVIKHFSRFHPLVADILKWRSLDTILGGFVIKLIKLAMASPDGRVYAHFNQTRTVIARLSSSNPINFQNQPRDRNLVRKAYVAYREGVDPPTKLLLGGDYCVVGGTRVATERGWVPIEEIIPGEDHAVQEDGSSAKITDLIERGTLPIVELETKLGYRLRATALHRIRVVDREGNYVWRRIGEIAVTDRVAVQAGSHTRRDELQTLPPLVFDHPNNNQKVSSPPTFTKEVAELFGYIVGDGCIEHKQIGVVVAQKDPDVWEWVVDSLTKTFRGNLRLRSYRGVHEARFSSRPVVRWLRELGVSKENLMPLLWSAPWNVTCAFLRGLFEADGSITKPSNGTRISWSSSRETLAREVQLLLLSAGFPTILRREKHKLGVGYKLTIPSGYAHKFAASIGFLGQRKRKKLALYLKTAGTSPTIGGFPNLREKVRKLDLSGEVRRLLNNTSSLGRPVSVEVANRVRRIDDSEYEEVWRSLELYRITDYDTIFDSVKRIETIGEEPVYDLSVPGPTTYISEGFVSHNSQIELRVASHLSLEENMIEVYSMKGGICVAEGGSPCPRYLWYECEDCHHAAPVVLGVLGAKTCAKCGSTNVEHQTRCRHVDLHQRTAEDAKVKRNPLAKNCNFGLLYRMGAPKFCVYADLFDADGMPMVDMAREIIARWHAAYPAVSVFHDKVEWELEHNGWIAQTLFGRRRRLDEERRFNHFRAVTQGVQFQVSGSAQDIMKAGMIRVIEERDRRIANAPPAESKLWQQVKMLLQIHDEVVCEIPQELKDEASVMVKQSMESVGQGYLRVPLTFEVKTGINWDSIH